MDFATVLKNPAGAVVPAIDHNHALFAQDAWTIGHGLTLNLGLRVEKETLPVPVVSGWPSTVTWPITGTKLLVESPQPTSGKSSS